ncbi:Flp pilus assembly protein CpaB, partial [bacterium]|nr:Flp pilus assembly protein CpaB [candidate division CSSED10-310 bacterium]
EENIQRPDVFLKKVVVARSDLLSGTKITSQNIKVVEWPEEIIPKGYFSNIEDLSDRVVKADVLEDEAILDQKLAVEGSLAGFSSIIPIGMRSLTVTVNDAKGVNKFISPKTRVDVITIITPTMTKEDAKAKILIENVEVLAVDQTFQMNDDEPTNIQTVTLLLTPEDTEKLALANNEGKLQLSLRNAVDSTFVGTPGIRFNNLIEMEEAPRRRVYRAVKSTAVETKKEEPSSRVVEIIRSNERQEVSFEDEEQKKKN